MKLTKKKIVVIGGIVVAIGLGAFYLYDSIYCSELNWDESFCVDNLPDFPSSIGDFTLTRYNKKNWEARCDSRYFGGEVCLKSFRAEYHNENTGDMVHVICSYTEKGNELYKNYIMENLVEKEIADSVFLSKENWEIFWSTDKEFNFIMTQTYKKTGGNKTANLENEVIQYFLNKYPPIN